MKKKGKKWYKSFSSWIVVLISFILIHILVSNLYIIFQSKTNQDKVPSIFGYKPFIVLSGSMEGKIHKGDLIITKIIDPNKLKKDDIIAFRDIENTVTTHRIIDIVENNGKKQFITKGDNNNTQDRNLVNLEDVEGIYIMRIGGFGSIMNSLANPTVILALSLLITVVFVICFMISLQKEKNKEQQEFMEYKMMKKYEEKRKSEQDELLELRRYKEQQERKSSSDELLEMLRSKEQSSQRRSKDDYDDFKF